LEARLANWSVPVTNATLFSLPGISLQLRPSGEFCAIDTMDALPAYGNTICASVAGLSDVTIRVQRDITNRAFRLEVWSTSAQAALTTYCGSAQAGTTRNFFPCPISTVNLQPWAGTGNLGDSGSLVEMAWIKWFSGVVPVGGNPSPEYVPADLADWRFEGNGNDLGTGGYSIQIGGSFAYSATPIYPPACNAGNSQTFRAGYPAQVSGAGSYPLDGGSTLTYTWQELSGPSQAIWSNQNSVQPGLNGLVAGTYIFQLAVRDNSGQSSVCTVKTGAVAGDNNAVTITGNTAVGTLLGPVIRYGANPWPWYDDRHTAAAKIQIANMDAYYADYWNTAASGTITVTANSAIVTGSGTSFTTTFCNGGAGPTTPKPGAAVIVWYPTNNPQAPGETGRRLTNVVSCQSDTQLTLWKPWFSDTAPGTGLSYTEQDNGNLTAWGYNGGPANFYDNVAAFYSLYYRSGIDDYLIAARRLADRFWTSPQVDRGTSFNLNGSNVAWPARSASILGLVLRALDGRSDMWPGLEKIFAFYQSYLDLYDITFGPGIWDTREEAYHLATVSYCALVDPNPSVVSSCQSSLSRSFANVWTPFRLSDGSWGNLYYSVGWTGSVSLTTGSASVVGTGTGWTSDVNGQVIWFTDSTTVPSLAVQNSGGDTATYTATFVDATHIMLDRPYTGATGTHGWAVGNGGGVGWGAQPYMMGIMATAFDFAAKALAGADPANSALAHSYNVAAANWIKTYGYWPLQKGLYYFANTANCQAPIADTNTFCTGGNNASQARTLSAEVIRGVGAAYVASGDTALRDFGDTLFSAMFSKPGTGGPNPDGSYLGDLEDGSGFYMTGIPPIGQAPKWFGLFFGFGDGAAWPGYRVGGPQQIVNNQLKVGFNMASIPGAEKVRVSVTAPSGRIIQAECSVSPCSVATDARQGHSLIGIQYLSGPGSVLASTSLPIIQ
jgi:hypothetical protein